MHLFPSFWPSHCLALLPLSEATKPPGMTAFSRTKKGGMAGCKTVETRSKMVDWLLGVAAEEEDDDAEAFEVDDVRTHLWIQCRSDALYGRF